MNENVKPLVIDNKPEQEIAMALMDHISEAIKPVLALMDTAATNGLQIQWDSVAVGPPYMKHRLIGLRAVKIYSRG